MNKSWFSVIVDNLATHICAHCTLVTTPRNFRELRQLAIEIQGRLVAASQFRQCFPPPEQARCNGVSELHWHSLTIQEVDDRSFSGRRSNYADAGQSARNCTVSLAETKLFRCGELGYLQNACKKLGKLSMTGKGDASITAIAKVVSCHGRNCSYGQILKEEGYRQKSTRNQHKGRREGQQRANLMAKRLPRYCWAGICIYQGKPTTGDQTVAVKHTTQHRDREQQ
ncbi:hypothetical protein PR048_020596 [Dryococelus australis]|uniref:Uncharacterized protein n=1 Tax=Dryococelus australis TaxID=614101 RepID=A0ABQ9H6Q5_9NEOP|nr:hypothetical protein PR048_020596 [Dryococelus australis]